MDQYLTLAQIITAGLLMALILLHANIQYRFHQPLKNMKVVKNILLLEYRSMLARHDLWDLYPI